MVSKDDKNGDYVRSECDTIEVVVGVHGECVPPNPRRRYYWDSSIWWWWWGKVVILGVLAVTLILVLTKWVGPFFINKEIIPILDWEIRTFNPPTLAVIIFASLALLPIILLPSTPSMWVAAMTFGYWKGFLLVLSGMAVGVTLPYFIGSLFYEKIQGWLVNHPKKASIIKLAGQGNWLHQFQAITLIRITPFPYVIFNYGVVATNVKYCPYLFGSLVGVVPEVFVALYSGMLIRTLADATKEQEPLSMPQIILNVFGLCATLAAIVIIGLYAKRKLDQLQDEEEKEQLLE